MMLKRMRTAAVGPYEFLKDFVRDWKRGRTSHRKMEKWIHAFGYAIPSHAMAMLSGKWTWELMGQVLQLGHKEYVDGNWPEWLVNDINKAFPKALKEMRPYKGMTSGEAVATRQSSDAGIAKVSSELLKLAREMVAVRWKEFNNSKGHTWTQNHDTHMWHITEIEGPGIPLYRLALIIDDLEGFRPGAMFKYKRQLPSFKKVQKIAAGWTKAFEDEAAGGIDLSKTFSVLRG